MLETREKLLDIREKLDGRLLVGDGAIDTFRDDRGGDQPYYKANLTHARIVRAIHEEYLRVGARVIETNTFLANRLKLADQNLEDKAREINVERPPWRAKPSTVSGRRRDRGDQLRTARRFGE